MPKLTRKPHTGANPRYITAARAARIKAGLTLADVARRTKYSARTIDQTEIGCYKLDEHGLLNIGRVTGATINDFVAASNDWNRRAKLREMQAAAKRIESRQPRASSLVDIEKSDSKNEGRALLPENSPHS